MASRLIWRVAGSVPSMGRQLKAAMPSDLKVKGGDEKREREREKKLKKTRKRRKRVMSLWAPDGDIRSDQMEIQPVSFLPPLFLSSAFSAAAANSRSSAVPPIFLLLLLLLLYIYFYLYV